MSKTLYIDFGNTNVKYCIEEKSFKISKAELYHLAQFIDNNSISRIISSEQFAKFPELSRFQKINKYYDKCNSTKLIDFTKVQGIGNDRVLSSIACLEFNPQNIFGVISFGTANTLTIVNKKKCIGGYIIPGFDASFRALARVSDKLAFQKESIDEIKLGDNTKDAVNYGILAAGAVGLLELALSYNKEIDLFITGGNAKHIHNILTNRHNSIFLKDNLVLNGLKYLHTNTDYFND